MKQIFCLLIVFVCIAILNISTDYSDNIATDTEKPLAVLTILDLSSKYSYEEKLLFREAAYEWFISTDNMAQFILILDKHSAMFLTNEKNFPDSLQINFVSAQPIKADTLYIMSIDLAVHGYTLGYYDPFDFKNPVIVTAFERISSAEEYKTIIKHELGHSLGLPHSKDRYTLMYKNSENVSECITQSDLAEFCKIYNCKNRKLKPCLPKIVETVCLDEDS